MAGGCRPPVRPIITDIMKTCKDCEQTLPLTEFYKRSDHDSHRPRCKRCHNLWKYHKDPEASRQRKHRERAKTYGLSIEELDKLLLITSCEICKKDIEGRQNIDHDHATGEVRGVLCSNCNRALGWLKDSRQNLINSIKYLERHDKQRTRNKAR